MERLLLFAVPVGARICLRKGGAIYQVSGYDRYRHAIRIVNQYGADYYRHPDTPVYVISR